MNREFPEEVTRREAVFLKRCQQVFGLICFDSFLPLTTPPWQEKQLTSAKPLCLSPALRPPFNIFYSDFCSSRNIFPFMQMFI